ncbi:FlgB family protein [Ruegeria arenilitoris]|uniref:FlgB family protein n=1 Tax=Ruegeria arenilitoris TaxID=1173585 RepID=UPI00147E63D3|nr:FlgB family protein [Ruegeria arenilitoris]
MFSDLNVFKVAYALATHAGQRQAVISRNMANADTPGYRARDIESFAEAFEKSSATSAMSATRDGHLNGVGPGGMTWAEHMRGGAVDPNGNGVSLEEEMLNAVEVKRQHDRALAIYKSSIGILRTGLGKA